MPLRTVQEVQWVVRALVEVRSWFIVHRLLRPEIRFLMREAGLGSWAMQYSYCERVRGADDNEPGENRTGWVPLTEPFECAQESSVRIGAVLLTYARALLSNPFLVIKLHDVCRVHWTRPVNYGHVHFVPPSQVTYVPLILVNGGTCSTPTIQSTQSSASSTMYWYGRRDP